jgi:hypothetical protein
MMKKSLFAAVFRGLLSAEALYHLDDEGVFSALHAAGSAFPERVCAEGVRAGRLFSIAAEFPFDEQNPLHVVLEDIKARTKAEARLAEALEILPECVIIDIPERITFESGLWIFDEQTPFTDSSTVFTKTTVNLFSQRLRKIRCMINSQQNRNRIKSRLDEFFKLYYNTI